MSICRGAKVVPHRRLFHPKWYQCCLAMVCKENVESWFRDLSSYSRIDVMCSLVNMCLPFEVRYLGTYVEDRGRIDYNNLRDTEHHANKPSNVNELSTLGVGDTRTRRKLILYVSLLHCCNYKCAEIIYKILENLEDQDIDSILSGTTFNQDQKDEQPLEELLLLYTMAHYHPSFNYEQKKRVGDILEKLQKEETRLNPPELVPSIESNDRLEGAGEVQSNCVMPPSPMQQYPPDVQMRPPIMSRVPGMTMPPPGLCMPQGTDQISMGASNAQYLPLGFPSAVSPIPPWQNQTVMMTPMNQMMYPSEIPGYPISPLVSRQSSPSQSRSPSRSNSPMGRRNNSNPPRWAFDERKDMSNQQIPQVPNPMSTSTSSSQSNVVANSGTSGGHLLPNRSVPSQGVPTRESFMTYSRHNSSDSVNVATATTIDNKSNKQPPPPGLRSSVSGDSIRESGKELRNFKGNLQDYSREEIRRLSDEDLREIGLTPMAVGQLRNIVRSQTTNGLSSQTAVSLPEKKQETPAASLHHSQPLSPLPPPECEVVQNCEQSNEASAMKSSPAPQPIPDLYQQMLHHHHHHNNHNIGGMRRYPTMPPLDPSQIPQMYTTPPPTLYPTQNSCYACFPVSGMQTRFTRCPSQHVYCLAQLQTLRLDDNSRQGSQSSSSDSTGSRSPPETPPAVPWVSSNTATSVMSISTSTGTSTTSSMAPGGTIASSSNPGGIPSSVMTTATATSTTPVCSDCYNPGEHNQGSIMVTHQGIPMLNVQQMSERARHKKGHMMRHKNHMMNGGPPVNMPPCVSAFPVSGHSPMTFLPHGHVSLRPNSGMYPNFSGYRPNYPASYQPNGEIMYPYRPPATGGTPPPATMPPSTVTVVVPSHSQQTYMAPAPVVPFTATVQQAKISCYNCGSTSHSGTECKDQTMDDITKRASYRLDYSTAKQPGDCPNDK